VRAFAAVASGALCHIDEIPRTHERHSHGDARLRLNATM
jgi:hypothetical protein